MQEISDSVGEAQRDDVDVGLALQIQRNAATQAELDRRIITGRARQRYVCTTLFSVLLSETSSRVQLNHLFEEQDTEKSEENERCILCDGELVSGYITRW